MPSSKPNSCPTCHSLIPEDAPHGLCPACSLLAAASIPPNQRERQTTSPSLENIAPHFPKLELLELLGAGGMGAVYKARQPQLDRFVAVKILSHELAQDPSFVERFNREAKVLARLSHPNIVAIHDFGTAGPYCYLMMEYVDGVNLREAMRTGGFKPSEALELVQEICSALQFAHEEGVLHRDIKPENVLLDTRGRVKIADFGIAKLMNVGDAPDDSLTLQGSIIGTPHYMAPEQLETPDDVDQRADIYSLGVVLYEMLTGELPIGRFALPSEKKAMDARIDEIVMRTLEKERERRYQTAGELKTEFEGMGHPAPPSQSAFINEQLLELSKYTFWISILLLAMLLLNLGDVDDLDEPTNRISVLAVAAIFLSSISGLLHGIHTIRKQGLFSNRNGSWFSSANGPVPKNQKALHLGLTAAILTGISLLFAVFTLYQANTMSGSNARMIVTFLGLGLDGPIAIIGFILGAKALGEIRNSEGQIRGLGSAIFAVVAWPICITGLCLLFSLRSVELGIASPLLFLLAGMPLLLASWVLVRGLKSWARGLMRKDGHRRFHGLAGILLTTLGLAILGPLLVGLFIGLHDSDKGPAGTDGETAQSATQPADPNSVEWVQWRLSMPEISWDITVASGMTAKLQLLLKDEDGSIRKIKIGDCAEQINGSPNHARLEIGTVLVTSKEPDSTAHAMTASFQSGRLNRLIPTDEDLRGFHFYDSLNGKLLLNSAGIQIIPFATRFAGKNELATGLLSLEVVVQ